MNCPECGRKFERAPRNRIILSNRQEYYYGVCQYCKEIAHFVYTPSSNSLYSWVGYQEHKYAKEFKALLGKKNILYIPSEVAEDDLFNTCGVFAEIHAQNAGFIVSYEYANKAEIVKAIYPIVVLPEQLFPEKPSFIAEKLILENVAGTLYSTANTIHDKFEKINL